MTHITYAKAAVAQYQELLSPYLMLKHDLYGGFKRTNVDQQNTS